MAENRLPDALPALFTLAEDLIDGLGTHQDTIGVKQNRADALAAALAAARTAENEHSIAKATKADATSASTVADSNVKAFIAIARDTLKPTLGPAGNPAWQEAGFPGGSLAVPATAAERQENIRKLAAYLAAHATLENAPLQITATRAQSCYEALRDTRVAVNEKGSARSLKKSTRDQSVGALRVRLRGAIDEIGQLIKDDDPRWLAFGLNLPAAPNTPDIPDGLVLHAGPAGSGTLYADWDDMPRADRYRVWKQIVGVDTEFVVAVTVTDSDATLAGLPAGKPIKGRVTAANDAGETAPGAASETVLA